jgi:hypothetical protein
MTVFKNPYFFIPSLLFWANQLLEKRFKIFIPYIHAYLDDLLAMPVILGISLILFQKIQPQKTAFSFSKFQVIVGTAYISFLFEFLLPKWSPNYTSDPWDVVCYAIGSWVFYKKINR